LVGRPASELWDELASDLIHTEFPTRSRAPIRRGPSFHPGAGRAEDAEEGGC